MLFRASTFPEIFNMFFWNLVIVGAYHLIIFVICVKLPQSAFDENKPRYQMKKFERNGKFYKQTLKINVWKEHVPQFTGKNGFSKEHMAKMCIRDSINAAAVHRTYPMQIFSNDLLPHPITLHCEENFLQFRPV